MPRIQLGDWVDSGVDWLAAHLAWLFDFHQDRLHRHVRRHQRGALRARAAAARGHPRGASPGGCADCSPASSPSPASPSSTPSSCGTTRCRPSRWCSSPRIITLVIAVPLGIWASRSERVSARDPAGAGLHADDARDGLPDPRHPLLRRRRRPRHRRHHRSSRCRPGVRMTELGIRQVDEELVEAADAFGTTSARHPAARPAAARPAHDHGRHQPGHHAGLSMVVIAGMVGGGGLGGAVYQAIGQRRRRPRLRGAVSPSSSSPCTWTG